MPFPISNSAGALRTDILAHELRLRPLMLSIRYRALKCLLFSEHSSRDLILMFVLDFSNQVDSVFWQIQMGTAISVSWGYILRSSKLTVVAASTPPATPPANKDRPGLILLF